MSKTDTFENDLLKAIFNNTADSAGVFGNTASTTPQNQAGALANLYVSLHTADPGETGNQSTSEVTYTGYARVAVARGAAWTVTGNSVSPASTISFGQRSDAGATQTATHFGVGTAASGTGKLLYKGTVTPNIAISQNVTPQLTTASTITED